MAAPLAVGALTIAGLSLLGVRSAGAMLGLGLTVFVASATMGEFARGALAHRGSRPFPFLKGLVTVVKSNRRRYGGYIVHLGVVLICLGISGVAFRESWSGVLSVGERFSIGSYDVTYESARTFDTDEKQVKMAVMSVSRDGRKLAELTPQRNLHFAQNQPQSEIGLRTTLSDDLYLVLTQMDASNRVTLRAWLNPLVAWIWIGGAFMAAGMVVILSGKPPAQRPVSRPLRREEKVAVPV
jgi:cytochrome c-type biogenesis protein CcmF